MAPVVVLAARDGEPALTFQHVPEPRAGKNGVHLDLAVDDLDAATGAAIELGASVLDEVSEGNVTVRVLADVEGNEFCLLRMPPSSP